MMTILSLRAVIAILAAVGFSSATLATPAYWNLFNVEGESTGSAVYVTYATLIDALTDSNRTGQYFPDNTGDAAANVVGSGSDGTAFWSLFNVEGESTGSAVYVTYASLIDMLTDSNRTGQYFPDNTGNAAANVVGSGAWIEPNGVPEPSTLWLLGSALLAHSIRRLSAVRALTPQEGSA
jgi:hypothetical protein